MSTSVAAPAPPKGRLGLAGLQRLGRSLMLPIAALPAAGLLLRLGQDDLLGAVPGLENVASVIGAAGGALFDNLPLISPSASRSAGPSARTAPPRWPPSSATWCSTACSPP